MKYKCIKDFWMEDTSREDGFKPAFAKGEVYDFRRRDGDFVTDKDHCGHVHYMPTEDINNYFELVEDKRMSIKWEEGKTYRFKPDMIDEFKRLNSSNRKIALGIRKDNFTVERIDGEGAVRELVEFSKYDADILYWFDRDEIRYFELVEDTTEESPDMTNTNNIRPDSDIVVEWLGKLIHVLQVDPSVDDSLNVTPAGISLHADYGTIYGPVTICNFITNRYDLLQQEAKHKKNNELMERKAKLEAELADVNKQLSEV